MSRAVASEMCTRPGIPISSILTAPMMPLPHMSKWKRTVPMMPPMTVPGQVRARVGVVGFGLGVRG